MYSARNRQRNLGFLLLTIVSQACAHSRTVPQTADTPTAQSPAPPSDIEVARQQITKLQDRVQDLEVRLSALNDKINLENGTGTPSAASNASAKMPDEVILTPAAHSKVIPEKKIDRKSKPETAEIAGSGDEKAPTSEAVDRFREAKILFDSKRYSDSVLEFSNFVKNEPDHPLASAAQYYVGMSYYRQNEYKLAEEELSRGLISYAHSAYVPDTLLALSEVSANLKKTAKVTYYREKLLGNFPNSPQAKSIADNKAVPKKDWEPEPTQTKAMETSGEPSVVARPEVPTVSVPTVESEAP